MAVVQKGFFYFPVGTIRFIRNGHTHHGMPRAFTFIFHGPAFVVQHIFTVSNQQGGIIHPVAVKCGGVPADFQNRIFPDPDKGSVRRAGYRQAYGCKIIYGIVFKCTRRFAGGGPHPCIKQIIFTMVEQDIGGEYCMTVKGIYRTGDQGLPALCPGTTLIR